MDLNALSKSWRKLTTGWPQVGNGHYHCRIPRQVEHSTGLGPARSPLNSGRPTKGKIMKRNNYVFLGVLLVLGLSLAQPVKVMAQDEQEGDQEEPQIGRGKLDAHLGQVNARNGPDHQSQADACPFTMAS